MAIDNKNTTSFRLVLKNQVYLMKYLEIMRIDL